MRRLMLAGTGLLTVVVIAFALLSALTTRELDRLLGAAATDYVLEVPAGSSFAAMTAELAAAGTSLCALAGTGPAHAGR